MKSLITLALFLAIPFGASAKVNVVTSTSDLNWLVHQIGGKRVSSQSLLNPDADPHFVDAMPHYIHKVSNADMVCFVGLDLEIGWLPKVLSKSGNAKVQPGGKGYCETGKAVKALDVVKDRVDRSMGDVHSAGNPHFHLSPTHFLQAAQVILETLMGLDPDGVDYYSANFESFSKKMSVLKNNVKTELSSFLKKHPKFKVIEYHKEFTYFLQEFGIPCEGTIEQTPGVAPSAGRLARIALDAKQQKVSVALAAKHSPKNLMDRFSEISKVPYVALPLSVDDSNTSFETYEKHLKKISKAVTQPE